MGPPSGSIEAGLAAVAVALGLMWLGFGLTGIVPAWRSDPVTRWALAFPAVVSLALLLMMAHIATGGALFHSPSAVRVPTALAAGALAVRWWLTRPRGAESVPPRRQDFRLAVACSLFVAFVWGSPVFRVLPLITTGDAALHAGWTEQLINGESTPTAPLTGDIPNYYPWLFHALLALLTHLTPGAHAYLGLAPLQLLTVMGTAAALFGLGHLFAGRWCGAAVTILASATGGIGFVLLRGVDLVEDPRAEGGAAATRYLGDLLFVRSFNVSFANLAPPYPRDVALALLVGALFAMARATRSGQRRDYVAAGVLLGLVGLTQTDAFFVGGLAAVAVAASSPAGRRLWTSVALLAPALALSSLWGVPMAVSYVRLGGFVNTTVVEPVVLPAWAILGGWGIVTPLAVVGMSRALRSGERAVVRVIAASLAAAVAALAASALASVVAGKGFETLGRQHRYWPLLCLPLALLAGLGVHWLAVRLRGRSKAAAWAVLACVLALALPSPLIASLAMPSAYHPDRSVTRALEGDQNEALNPLSDYGSGVCSAAVANSATAFSYTGFRFVLYGAPRIRDNAARIRWAEIYDRIVPQRQRQVEQQRVLRGSATPEQLQRIVRRYGLDIIMVPAKAAATGLFRGLPGRPVRFQGREYVLYGLDAC